MTSPELEFALIVERGPLEAQAVLLCESIRLMAGRYSDVPIAALSPRADWRPAQITIDRLQELGVTYHALDLTSPVPSYGTSFRVLGLGWLARQPGAAVLVQLDSDTVFVGEPDLDLGDAIMLGRPVDDIGMHSTGAPGEQEAHWQAMCRANGIEVGALGWVETWIGGTRVRASYNGGLIAARRALFAEAEACFTRIVEAGLRSWPNRHSGERIGAGHASVAGYAWWGTSQAALGIAAARLGGSVGLLDERHNVPLHRFDKLPRIPFAPVHLHYHWLFEDRPATDAALDRLPGLSPERREWLAARTPLALRSIESMGVFSPEPVDFPSVQASPACSVVMTSYRDTRFLREAVDSLLAQDFADFELIVVDDGSPDPAPAAALEHLDPRVRVLRLAQNLGTAEAANRGIALARAPIIARLDSDDCAQPAWLSQILGALTDDPELGLVGSAVTLIDEAGRSIGVQPMPESDFAIRFTLLFHSPFYHSTVAYRRSLFDAAGGYRADQPISQDHYLWAAMLPLARARNLRAPLVRYRLNSAGLTAGNSAGDPQRRTAAIRAAAWREIGLACPLAARQLHDDASALLRGHPVTHRARRAAACETIEVALRRVEALADDFLRPVEAAEAALFAANLRKTLGAGAARAPSLAARAWRSLRRRGLAATIAAVSRKVGLKLSMRHSVSDGIRANPVMAALHEVSPYVGFDARRHRPDVQGWGSDDPVFRALIAELRPNLIVEVGSWKGASAIHMAGLCREFGLTTRIVCVDTWLGSSEHVLGRRPGWRSSLRPRNGYPQLYFTFLANVVRAGHADRIVPFANTSDTAAAVLAEKGLRPELIYIDAAHDEAAVWRDLSNYWPLLAPGGVLLGDDFANYPGVRRAAMRFALEHGLTLEDCGDKFVLRAGGARVA